MLSFYAICYLFYRYNSSSHQLNSKNNGPVLIFKAIFRHGNCFMSSFKTDGKDGHRLKLQKVGLTCSRLMLHVSAMSAKITKRNDWS